MVCTKDSNPEKILGSLMDGLALVELDTKPWSVRGPSRWKMARLLFWESMMNFQARAGRKKEMGILAVNFRVGMGISQWKLRVA
jgi:hypothetical protein